MKNAVIRTIATVVMGGIVLSVAGASVAATPAVYPDRPIRFVVGFPPGGTADVLARAIGRELTE